MLEISLLIILILTAGAAFIFYRQKKQLEEKVEELERTIELQKMLDSAEADGVDETVLL